MGGGVDTLSLLIAAAFAAHVAFGTAALRAGQDASRLQRIEWSRARKLQWRDFAMRAPRSSDAAHSWVGIDADWTCDASGLVFHVTASFDPAQSWVKPGSESGALLRHEQTHFDLTEVATREMRKRLKALDDPCRSFMTMRDIDAAIVAERQAWDQDQHRYDRETDFGTNDARQQFWDRRTQERLTSLEEFQ
jgi:hypothetical protein